MNNMLLSAELSGFIIVPKLYLRESLKISRVLTLVEMIT